MFVYFAYAVPLTRRISRGFYADGVWAENGFIPYHQIGGIAWRQGEPPTLLLISRFKEMARPLPCPAPTTGPSGGCSATRLAATTSCLPAKRWTWRGMTSGKTSESTDRWIDENRRDRIPPALLAASWIESAYFDHD